MIQYMLRKAHNDVEQWQDEVQKIANTVEKMKVAMM